MGGNGGDGGDGGDGGHGGAGRGGPVYLVVAYQSTFSSIVPTTYLAPGGPGVNGSADGESAVYFNPATLP